MATLKPLTDISGNKTKFEWTETYQQTFNRTKDIMAEDVMLRFPDFNHQLDIHTDASPYQIGGIVSQKGNPIGFDGAPVKMCSTNNTGRNTPRGAI